MKLYKLLHKPTGLFYQPSRTGCSNFSKKGKVYHNRIKINNHIGATVVIKGKVSKEQQLLLDYFNLAVNNPITRYFKQTVFTPASEWEYVEVGESTAIYSENLNVYDKFRKEIKTESEQYGGSALSYRSGAENFANFKTPTIAIEFAKWFDKQPITNTSWQELFNNFIKQYQP